MKEDKFVIKSIEKSLKEAIGINSIDKYERFLKERAESLIRTTFKDETEDKIKELISIEMQIHNVFLNEIRNEFIKN